MMVRTRTRRPAFTLVELLVVMSVMIVLASLALLVVPAALDQDRTTDGAALTRQYLMIAKARAARDNAPRGVRLVVAIDPNNVVKGNNVQWVTELQYVEKLPVYIPSPVPASPPIGPLDPFAPKVVFIYTLSAGPPPAAAPPLGALQSVQVQIQNLSAADVGLIQPGSLLSLFNLGFSGRITGVGAPTANSLPNGPVGSFNVPVALDVTPDPQLGAAGMPGATLPMYVSYQFGITTPARPLLGEPSLPLPNSICIDLQSSGLFTGNDVDIVFLPSGHVDPSSSVGASNQLNLWIRDYAKPGGLGGDFAQGGEQQCLSLKTKTGSLGAFPIAWPPDAPFKFAMQGATVQ